MSDLEAGNRKMLSKKTLECDYPAPVMKGVVNLSGAGAIGSAVTQNIYDLGPYLGFISSELSSDGEQITCTFDTSTGGQLVLTTEDAKAAGLSDCPAKESVTKLRFELEPRDTPKTGWTIELSSDHPSGKSVSKGSLGCLLETSFVRVVTTYKLGSDWSCTKSGGRRWECSRTR